MTIKAATDVWTFADFRPGQSFGEMSIILDASRLAKWEAIYGGGSEPVVPSRPLPRGMLVTCMMEAYLGLIQPRPPGNIHAGQSLDFGSGHVRLGDTVTMTATCRDKTERKGRGWVTFALTVTRGADTLLSGDVRSVWAR
ncbi:Acyl dehydratase [Roseovarius pacificus]|uniref:Acyl dehydratase n=1 Tax=Roseovarius pacificus TaxID=337701 RepID=A0A1M7KHS5_9RHOB|nr:MaoC family dehydratase [Roseovarius pacificus]GGO62745.1 hypothetical protein GCM10011315_42460 [Roseovarius pacificus]SHM64851.1 Acyl dehydratase [Roseovarius pacificus]